jgi:hypothetical protein
MPFPNGASPVPTLLIGALLLLPAAASAGDLFGRDAQDEFLASLSGDPEAQAKARAREDFVRNFARRIEDRATEKLLLTLAPDRPDGPDGRDVLATIADPAPEPSKSSFRKNFRVNLRRGVEYRHKVDVGDQVVSMKLWGPIVGSKPGLGFAVDGLVEEHRVRLKAYGSTEKAGLQLELEF